METRIDDIPGPSAPLSGSQVTRRETRGDDDGRHYPVPKLQEERHEESMMGGKRSRFPKTPGTTIRLPSCRETRGEYDGRQELAISWDPWHHQPAPKLHKLPEGRHEEIMMGDKTWRFRGTPGTTINSLAQI